MSLEDELKRAAAANTILRKENDDLRRRLELLAARDEHDSLSHGLSFKVSEKGALSVYDLQAFPVTLYKDQWHRVLWAARDMRAFMDEHDAELLTKAEARNRKPPKPAKPRLVRGGRK